MRKKLFSKKKVNKKTLKRFNTHNHTAYTEDQLLKNDVLFQAYIMFASSHTDDSSSSYNSSCDSYSTYDYGSSCDSGGFDSGGCDSSGSCD